MKRISYSLIKRVFDILFALTALIALLPLYFLIAVIIKTTSKGPLFYTSVRVGQHYRPFICYKFRTMVADAESHLDTLLRSNPDMQKEWAYSMKLKKDPRVTPFGHFLRKSSLDELPQFFNVLKGDLSVVGPRPFALSSTQCDIQKEMERYLGSRCHAIFSVKPGITGLWQTSGRSELPLRKRRQLELCYVRRQSFALDLILILKTLPAMIFARGAY